MNEVIIDGVNVAECEHLWKDNSVIELNFCRINFDNNYFSNGIPCCDKCNKYSNCYFKQLQRAKAELEKLKAEVKEIRTWEELKLSKYRKALEDIRARIKQYHLKVGGEVVGSDTIFDIEKIINILKREQTDREGIGCKYPSALELSIQLSKNTIAEAEKLKSENKKLKAELENYRRVD